MQMLSLKFHGEISTSFGTFDSLKCSLGNIKIGQIQNFENRKIDKKKYFLVNFDLFFQGIDHFVEICLKLAHLYISKIVD